MWLPAAGSSPPPGARKRAQSRGHGRRDQDHGEHRSACRDGEDRRPETARAGVEREAATRGPERLVDDQRGEDRGRDERGDAQCPLPEVAAAEHERAGGLGEERADRERGEGDPDRGHAIALRLRRPISAAPAAATTGNPAGATGSSTSTMSDPRVAAAIAGRPFASPASSTAKKAGNIASRPSAPGSSRRLPPSTPAAVPVTQAAYCGTVAPISTPR